MAQVSLKVCQPSGLMNNRASPRALLRPRDGFCSVGPRLFDQFFDGRILRLVHRSDLDVACSLPDALEQVMRVVEPGSEQESEGDIRLHGRDVTDAPERRIVNRVVDGVIVKELVRSMHRASRHLAQLSDYCPYFFRIVREKLFDRIRHRLSSLSKSC